MKKSLLLFALLLWVGVQTVMAQTKAKGKVIDGNTANSEGLPGATVKVVGGAATITDADGNFEITLPEGSSGKIEISATGYGTQTLTAGDNMSVTMENGDNTIEQVTVTAPYGKPVTKADYVGAADVITAKQIEKMPVTDITQAIEGSAPGVQVTNGTGQPGSGASLIIRGQGTLGGSSAPLIVLDGTIYDGDITSINPMDVQDMNILKDAVATSLYGAKGSNGVIVINTKRGKLGEKPRITFDGKVGTETRMLPNYKVITDPAQYYHMAWQGQVNQLIYQKGASASDAGAAASGAGGIVDGLAYNNYSIMGLSNQNASLLDPVTGQVVPNAQLLYHDDWTKAMQRTGLRQDYNMNLSGGSDRTTYYLSTGYTDEKGFLLNTDYQRFSTRLNVNSQATDWLNVGLNFTGGLSTQNGTGGSGTSSGNPTYLAQTMPTIYPVYYRNANNNKVIDPATGKYAYDFGSLGDYNDAYANGAPTARPNLPGNVISDMLLDENRINGNNVVVAPYMEIKLPKNFTLRSNLSYNLVNQLGTTWQSTVHGIAKSAGDTLGGFLALDAYKQYSYTWNQNLGWSKKINEDNELSINAIHENYALHYNDLNASVKGFANDDFRDMATATGTPSASSSSGDDKTEDYKALFNYAFKGKYLLAGNVNRSGSSRFYSDSRWGNFGAIGGAWIISKENFMKNVSWVNSLKLKADYGTTGDLNIPGGGFYAWQGLYDLSRSNGTNQAAIPTTLTNQNLKWETQKLLNFGAEFSLLHDRLSGEVNLYNKQTAGLYYNVPQPPSTGFTSYLQNVGSMYNRGIEVNLFATLVRPTHSGGFEWDVNFNAAHNVNKVTYLAPGIDSAISGNTILKPGLAIGEFYLPHSAGINHSTGAELYSYVDGSGKAQVDSNYTNILNDTAGRRYAGSPWPKLTGAITNTFSYKGFDLSFLITFSIGGKYLDATYQGLMGTGPSGAQIGGSQFAEDMKNSWTPTNETTNLPRFEYGNSNIGQTSDRFLVSASYLNFRNLNLRYHFPEAMVKKAHLSALSAYVAANNVALISARKGMNPQNSFDGMSDYVYQPARTLMVGLTLGL